ncbi:hypothetical protein [Pelagicoccus mobilis]|uniref:Uncharacterized protein n=1 Tax=Pelagicoccus mobilis TaxID=415221 RepID=A0A934RYF7_9BACT|nr:hypothetical protein [Pelagicoccus mobilis]MBK1878653.1 hypothetical protein [Pelagicoccus mobilis]
MKPLQEISDAQAQQLMSLLHDGELSPEGAERLNEYLQSNPEAIDWLENLDATSDLEQSCPTPSQKAEAVTTIQESIAAEAKAPSAGGNVLLRFPTLFRPIAAAAAVAVIGTVTWLGLRPSATAEFEPNIVEFVASDIPDSSTYVYSDEESGWTVVWVDSDSGEFDSQG